ncbi:Hypothetical predicted protein, partial [Paramuricea clavata]
SERKSIGVPSDHKALTFDLNFTARIPNDNRQETFDLKKADFEGLRTALRNDPLENYLDTDNDVEQNGTSWKTQLFSKLKPSYRSASLELTIEAQSPSNICTAWLSKWLCSRKILYYAVVVSSSRLGNLASLFGLEDPLKTNLIKLNERIHEVQASGEFGDKVMEKHKYLFDDNLGELPVVYSMKVDRNVTPVINPPRKIPIAMGKM